MTESMDDRAREWDRERAALLDRPISSLGLTLRGTMLERLSERLYAELVRPRPGVSPTDLPQR